MVKQKNIEEASRLYDAGLEMLEQKNFYQAMRHFHKSIELNPEHEGANFEVFVEKIDHKSFEEALLYLVIAYKNCTGKRQHEYGRYLRLLSFLIDLPDDLKDVSSMWQPEYSEEIDALLNDMNFVRFSNLIQTKCKNCFNDSKTRVLFMLAKNCEKELKKNKAQIVNMAQKRDYEGIIEYLESMMSRRILDRYEKFMLQIAKDILYIKKNGEVPVIGGFTNNFITALQLRDYEGVFRAPDRDIYFSNAVWAPVVLLLKHLNRAVREIKNGKSSDELFAIAEKYWNNGEIYRAYDLYKKCYEIEPEHQGCLRKLFIFCIISKKYTLAVEYFELWNKPCTKAEIYEYNTFLFLLNNIVELSPELSKKAKALYISNIGFLCEKDDRESIDLKAIRNQMYEKRFLGALLQLKKIAKNRELSETEETILKMLSTADKEYKNRQATIWSYISRDDIEGLCQYLRKLDERTGLDLTEKNIYIVSKNIHEFTKTGQSPTKRGTPKNSIFSAIECRDYELTFRLDSEHVATYGLERDALHVLLKKMQVLLENREDIFAEKQAEDSSIEDSKDDFFSKGRILYKSGRHYEAFCMYKKCLEENPNHYGAAFELFVQCCVTGKKDEMIDHYRRMLKTSIEKEKIDNAIYLYLLNITEELPQDLKKLVIDISSICFQTEEGTSFREATYNSIYVAIAKSNFKRAMSLLKDLISKCGIKSKDLVLKRLINLAFEKTLKNEKAIISLYEQGEYEAILQLLSEIENAKYITIRERAIRSMIEDILYMKDSGTVPLTKDIAQTDSVFTAIFAKDYRRARKNNKKYLISKNIHEDILMRLIDDCIGIMIEIESKWKYQNVELTLEEKISIEDLCGTNQVPDIIKEIKNGIEIETALHIYEPNRTERYLVYIMMAQYYFERRENYRAHELLTAIEEVGNFTNILGKFYRYVYTSENRKPYGINRTERQKGY